MCAERAELSGLWTLDSATPQVSRTSRWFEWGWRSQNPKRPPGPWVMLQQVGEGAWKRDDNPTMRGNRLLTPKSPRQVPGRPCEAMQCHDQPNEPLPEAAVEGKGGTVFSRLDEGQTSAHIRMRVITNTRKTRGLPARQNEGLTHALTRCQSLTVAGWTAVSVGKAIGERSLFRRRSSGDPGIKKRPSMTKTGGASESSRGLGRWKEVEYPVQTDGE
ncbi:hypothetical protein QBC39DRAFT_134562 [Podospora conica]|nr:hypothetical protein QBC39DRAFT_134562 [Schizothecium conicum]